MPHAPASRHWRRRLRVTVGRLMVIVLVVGARRGWIVRSTFKPSAGGGGNHAGRRLCRIRLRVDEQPNASASRAVGAWRWLVNAIGVDYFAHASVATVGLLYTDERMARVERLPTLRLPCRSGTQSSRAGLAPSERLDQALRSRPRSLRSPMPAWQIWKVWSTSRNSTSSARTSADTD